METRPQPTGSPVLRAQLCWRSSEVMNPQEEMAVFVVENKGNILDGGSLQSVGLALHRNWECTVIMYMLSCMHRPMCLAWG